MTDWKTGPNRICVITSYSAVQEPRAPKHVNAVLEIWQNTVVYFVDMAVTGEEIDDPQGLFTDRRLQRHTLRVPTRKRNPIAWFYRKIFNFIAVRYFSLTQHTVPAVLGARAVGLTHQLKQIKADLYIAHNADTLLPAAIAADANRAMLIVDCMELYADMGDSQTIAESKATAQIEAKVLPRCSLVLTTSESLANVLSNTYKIHKPIVLHNVPPTISTLPYKEHSQSLRLYWRNSVVDFGQRGLDDALVAMTLLPENVMLSLQGKLPIDGGKALRARIEELGLANRVAILSPYSPGNAVNEAALHDVGLCMERRGPANHDYTVSNKLFDYMMAGLAVIVPNLDGLMRVVRHAGSGLIYQAGDPKSLADQILTMYRDPGLLERYLSAARTYALTEGNLEHEIEKFKRSLVACIGQEKCNENI